MPSFDPLTSLVSASDADLVTASLGGDREAFRQIVERYQRLLCSLAYSATGQLSQSEDLAQETFLEAWRSLEQLREPAKLKSWLCGILRFKVSRFRRENRNEPLQNADGLDAAEAVSSDEVPIPSGAVKKEEQAILWSALERVPEIYREPLVLFYREHRSIEHVAGALDLTEDAVKQRLARGRKLLQEQVLAFVEGALARSTPGSVFTVAVLAALPVMATPAKAITAGAAAAHAGTALKWISLAAFLASVSGLVSSVLSLRVNLDQSRTKRERREVVKMTITYFFGAMGFLAALYLLVQGAARGWAAPFTLALVAQAIVVLGSVLFPVCLLRTAARFRRMRTEERQKHPEAFLQAIDRPGSGASEYRSRWSLLGVPLVRIRFSASDAGDPPIVAWIAGGDRAYGLLAAWGGIAVAPVSIGAISFGVLSIGSLSVGVISLGTFAIGITAMGCASIGVKAFAWLSALGWEIAAGSGFAIAKIAALSSLNFAWAQHANDPFAQALLAAPDRARGQEIFYILIAVGGIIPTALYARAVRRRMGKGSARK